MPSTACGCCRDKLVPLVALGFHCRELDAFASACRAPACRRSVLLTALACGMYGMVLTNQSMYLYATPSPLRLSRGELEAVEPCKHPPEKAATGETPARDSLREPSGASALSTLAAEAQSCWTCTGRLSLRRSRACAAPPCRR